MKLFASTFLFFFLSANLHAQILYHQDTFHGGVTGGGFSTNTGSGTVTTDINIPPGSVIKKAFLFASRDGLAQDISVTLNGIDYVFSDLTSITDSFISVIYSSWIWENSSIHAIDITADVSAFINSYSLTIPPQFDITVNGFYSSFYLYIIFENSSFPKLTNSIIINEQDVSPTLVYNCNDLSPINNLFPVGLEVWTTFFCDTIEDGSFIEVNGYPVGLIGGQETNSGYSCSGVYTNFSHYNELLVGIGDDDADSLMSGTEVLSDIKNYLTYDDSDINVSFNYQSPGQFYDKFTNPVCGIMFSYTTTCDTFSVSVLTEDTTICKGDSLQFLASGADSYAWSPSTGLSCDDCADPKISPSQTTTYFLTSTKYGNCKKVQPIKIRVVDKPVINSFTLTADTCGENSGAVSNLNASGVAPLIFSLNGNSSSTFSNLQSGVYNLAVEDANGCTADSLIFIESLIAAEAGFTANPDIGFVPLEVLFTNESSFTNNYIWYIQGDTLTSENPTYIFDSVGTYTVTQIAYNTNFWCADTSTATIHVYPPVSVFIPNVITVNDDNINDDFTIQLEGGEYIWCTVINRWGQTVYETEQYIDTPPSSYNLWDGINMFTHEPATAGVYFYRIVVKSPVGTSDVFTGSLTVVR